MNCYFVDIYARTKKPKVILVQLDDGGRAPGSVHGSEDIPVVAGHVEHVAAAQLVEGVALAAADLRGRRKKSTLDTANVNNRNFFVVLLTTGRPAVLAPMGAYASLGMSAMSLQSNSRPENSRAPELSCARTGTLPPPMKKRVSGRKRQTFVQKESALRGIQSQITSIFFIIYH